MPFASDQSETLPPPVSGRAGNVFEQLLEAHVKTIVQQLIELAEKGDPTALRLCLERIIPPLRERPLQFELPPMEVPADAVAAIAAITRGLADGELSAAEGLKLARMVRVFAEILALAGREEHGNAREERNAEARTGQSCAVSTTQLRQFGVREGPALRADRREPALADVQGENIEPLLP